VKQRELLPAVLDALSRAPVDEIVVVEGAHRLTLEPGSRVLLVRCEDWEAGPGASLRCGLAALGEGVSRAVVVLADGPELDPRAIARLLERPEPVVAASYDGTRSHPVVLDRSVWGELPDEGGRALDPLLVDCSDLPPPGDVDYRR
jgi:CTP:molybdopterin cytidylyltransferase MocA